MSFARTFLPALRLRRLLSATIQAPSRRVSRQPVAPKAAVVISAGRYFGASLFWKMFELDDRDVG